MEYKTQVINGTTYAYIDIAFWLFRGGRATDSDKIEPLHLIFRACYPQLGATQRVTPLYLCFEN